MGRTAEGTPPFSKEHQMVFQRNAQVMLRIVKARTTGTPNDRAAKPVPNG
ncbi:hypothetical protein [Novipirellula rosea]